MSGIRKTLTVFLLLLFVIFVIPGDAHAQVGLGYEWKGTCVGGTLQDGSPAEVATIQGLECLIANVLSVSMTLIGMGGFTMFIYGSFKWMLSGGDTQAVKSARSAMTFAVIGIVIALSAYILLSLISSFTGVDVTEFVIPDSTTDYFKDTP